MCACHSMNVDVRRQLWVWPSLSTLFERAFLLFASACNRLAGFELPGILLSLLHSMVQEHTTMLDFYVHTGNCNSGSLA